MTTHHYFARLLYEYSYFGYYSKSVDFTLEKPFYPGCED